MIKTSYWLYANYLFEIGGKKKSGRQIAAPPNTWVVRDDMEYPVGKYISAFYTNRPADRRFY